MAIGERGFSKTEFNSKWGKDSWGLMARKQSDQAVGGKLLGGDINSRGILDKMI